MQLKTSGLLKVLRLRIDYRCVCRLEVVVGVGMKQDLPVIPQIVNDGLKVPAETKENCNIFCKTLLVTFRGFLFQISK